MARRYGAARIMADIFTYDAVLFDLFGTLVDDEAKAFAGAQECLLAVQSSPWAIVTSCGTSFARKLIAHARLPSPPVLVTADDVIHNKPAPDGYLCAASRLGVDSKRSLVVEDTLQGIAAAREAGMDVVALRRGRRSGFEKSATFVLETIADLRLRTAEGVLELSYGE
jgi:mannitol-1-/sugar-/sorbitol-6-phosphatase